jgi:hypothetical protein
MFGRAGINSVSSAQSKRGGAGLEHSSVGLGGGKMRDGDCKTTVAWGSGVPVAAEGAEEVEMAHSQVSWGRVRSMDSADGMGSRCGLSTGVDVRFGSTGLR